MKTACLERAPHAVAARRRGTKGRLPGWVSRDAKRAAPGGHVCRRAGARGASRGARPLCAGSGPPAHGGCSAAPTRALTLLGSPCPRPGRRAERGGAPRAGGARGRPGRLAGAQVHAAPGAAAHADDLQLLHGEPARPHRQGPGALLRAAGAAAAARGARTRAAPRAVRAPRRRPRRACLARAIASAGASPSPRHRAAPFRLAPGRLWEGAKQRGSWHAGRTAATRGTKSGSHVCGRSLYLITYICRGADRGACAS